MNQSDPCALGQCETTLRKRVEVHSKEYNCGDDFVVKLSSIQHEKFQLLVRKKSCCLLDHNVKARAAWTIRRTDFDEDV